MQREALLPQNNALIAHHYPKSPEAEAFKVLRTNLQFLGMNKEIRSIAFTSSGPDEGKSTVLANLAVTLAQTGKKILVIDADLRLPVQHKIFTRHNAVGLTNVLAENADLDECIRETKSEGVYLLSSGPIPPNPAELLASERMTCLIKKLTERFDYVLVDTPPVLAVTDAVLLSVKVDGIILVAVSGRTRIDRAKEAKEHLVRAKARILGVVLNSVERSREDHYYYYYYGEGK
ncbi:polysaccharide biosynthesis tyrosine autokinase [Thermanaerosceptrum fracticalcis]|uniref:non-specific protein-tyrosine kinase n=1 Tax=Thermanaerosceptrum fracticalcis TaxID=1712410 RepID=A0A7G6E4U9_THEFR|nr:CpsD/CapB family tyrosine-protein kinase [Thermanaerosceptrum fracticalcis]QNB47103.1 polysaccharide biosynthesis tyrosine autokinase [Thermanaerosceptrum fracticalcis]